MSSRPAYRVTITDCDIEPFSIEQSELAGVAELAIAQCTTAEQVIAASRSADAILIQYAPITATVMDSLPRCRIVARYGVGVDMIDVAAASHRGIYVCNVPGYCAEEVSEHACALMLALVRGLAPLHQAVKRGAWDLGPARPLWRLRGQTVGLLGFGRIGRLVARKMRGFGVRLIACDPNVEPGVFEAEGVTAVGMQELLARSDILSLHVPLTPQTFHVIGARELAAMRKGALLVNTSRGRLIDENALLGAVRDRGLGGVGLDVVENEPIRADHPLLGLPNVIITPHAAFYSETSASELKRQTARAAARLLKGEPQAEGDEFAVINLHEVVKQRSRE